MYSPLNNIRLSLRKQQIVLDKLIAFEKLTQTTKKIALKDFIKRYQIQELTNANKNLIALYGASRDFRHNTAPAINEYVKDFLYKSIPEDLILEGGLRIYTTINSQQQKNALKQIRAQVKRLRQKMSNQGSGVEPKKIQKWSERLNGVLVSLDAFTSEIHAIVGGYHVTEGNMTQRVWAMQRQPGSSIKGFLYATALDEGTLQANSLLMDQPVDISGYVPRNWNNQYLGEVPLAQAIAMSINTIAVETLNKVGIYPFRKRLFQALQLQNHEQRERFPANLSLALGSGEVTPLELAQIYAPLLNGGYPIKPFLIQRIEQSDHSILWEISKRERLLPEAILSEETCNTTLNLLHNVFDPEWNGTASFVGKTQETNANYLPFAIAGKTGTVQMVPEHRKRFGNIQGVRDAWFVGLVPREVSVIWFGQDEGAPIPASGSTAAATWAKYAQQSYREITQKNFTDPQLEEESIESENAQIKSDLEETETDAFEKQEKDPETKNPDLILGDTGVPVKKEAIQTPATNTSETEVENEQQNSELNNLTEDTAPKVKTNDSQSQENIPSSPTE